MKSLWESRDPVAVMLLAFANGVFFGVLMGQIAWVENLPYWPWLCIMISGGFSVGVLGNFEEMGMRAFWRWYYAHNTQP
jgi:hypothetical protein